jgi:signal transduction histidine kinase
VQIYLRKAQDTVTMAIHDNGCGFNLAEKSKGGGMGLANMQDRAAALGGKLDIITQPSAGTIIIVTIEEAA